MQQSPSEPPPKPAPQDAEQPGAKVVQFTPRRRLEPDRTPESPPSSDDNDPGPNAA